jgi:hypothetical protein
MSADSHLKNKTDRATGHVDAWLGSWGFVRNPFEVWKADEEDLAFLQRYYIKPPFYEQLLTENKSALIFGWQGGGKSAARIMLESECRPYSRSSAILAASFTDFSTFAEDLFGTRRPMLRDYLRQAMKPLLRQLILALSTGSTREFSLKKYQIGEFLYWLQEYASDWTRPKFLQNLIIDIVSLEKRAFDIRQAPHEYNASSKGELRSPGEAQLRLIWKKLEQGSTSRPERGLDSPSHIMAAFAEFSLELLSSQGLNCQALYLLVDGVDEYDLTRDDPQAAAALIKPMLSNVHFLEKSGVAMKFFLPMEFRRAFEKVSRPDRIPTYTISWSSENKEQDAYDRMKKLLRARLHYYGQGEIQSLSEMCTSELRNVIEDSLLRETKGIPRSLLRLGNQIFIEHCREAPMPGSEISSEDWDNSLSWFRETIAPPDISFPTKKAASSSLVQPSVESGGPMLRVDLQSGRVFVGEEELEPPLPELEHNLLSYLYQHKGQICSRSNIMKAVYGSTSGISDQSLGALVYRLRRNLRKLASDWPSTHFVDTASHRGYMLKNTS